MAIKPKLFKQMTKLIAGSMSAGRYDVRLAESDAEVIDAQKLRYRVLYKESGGTVTPQMLNSEQEEDEWDEIAYHVVVLDRRNDNHVVGTMRLVSSTALKDAQQFYTEHAFDITGLRARYGKLLELSRACVSPDGRGGAILMLIWKFTMQFIEQNQYDVMLGCASFKGTDYLEHTEILSYLYDKHLASPELMPIPKPAVHSVSIKSFSETPGKGKERGKVPTMLRGYLKIGAHISDHAVIDPVFNTTFVAIYVDASYMFGSNHALVNKSVHH
ncbi:GNAT family N-acetyltransferase [Arenicella xantha]|uniref:L-ornithine N(alpha)-acyltransferase n=1 Tax=Arenicella xantha TaxID=644221 RepID=A0A395JL12_9GAMM|nr:GNAT family N-acetyltransferase [Arenicella xantha]RBP51391.1 putative hemolysin [Arenicella xantha]